MIDNIKRYQEDFKGARIPQYEKQFIKNRKERVLQQQIEDYKKISKGKRKGLINPNTMANNIKIQNQNPMQKMKLIKKNKTKIRFSPREYVTQDPQSLFQPNGLYQKIKFELAKEKASKKQNLRRRE